MALQLTRHRFTVAEYYRMAAVGILHEDAQVELIEGQVVDMPRMCGPRIRALNRLGMLFTCELDDAITQIRSPIRLDDYTQPVPDLALLRAETDDYPAAPSDVLAVIEVADTTLLYDQDVKVPLYARAGIPEAWIVDLNCPAVLVHRDPSPDGYCTVFTVQGDQPIAPLTFPDFTLTTRQMLG